MKNIKRGLIRLWIVIAAGVDLYALVVIIADWRSGASYINSLWTLFFTFTGLNVLWFVILAAVFWVLNGFFPKTG